MRPRSLQPLTIRSHSFPKFRIRVTAGETLRLWVDAALWQTMKLEQDRICHASKDLHRFHTQDFVSISASRCAVGSHSSPRATQWLDSGNRKRSVTRGTLCQLIACISAARGKLSLPAAAGTIGRRRICRKSGGAFSARPLGPQFLREPFTAPPISTRKKPSRLCSPKSEAQGRPT